MSHGHAHSHAPDPAASSERRLWIALALSATFLVAEVIASFITGSLALLSDAGHMATDAAGLAIALLAIRIGRRPADARRSFGYRRLEVLAAALNASALFIVAAYVLWEALVRLRSPPAIDSTGMLIVAILGLAVNAMAMRLLSSGRDSSLNVRAAYLEVWADFLGSIAVIAGAVLIRLTGARWIDPVIAIVIALWVLPRGRALLRSATHVLLEGTPEGMDPEGVRRTLLSVSGVRGVHDLHIWSVTVGVPLLSAHVQIDDMNLWDATLLKLIDVLEREHRIQHTTLQPEIGAGCGKVVQQHGCRP